MTPKEAGQMEEVESVRLLNMIAKSKTRKRGGREERSVPCIYHKLIIGRKIVDLQQQKASPLPPNHKNSSAFMARTNVLQTPAAPRLCSHHRVMTLWHSVQKSLEAGRGDINVWWLQIFQGTIWCGHVPLPPADFRRVCFVEVHWIKGRWVTPCVTWVQEAALFSSFGIASICLSIHFLIRHLTGPLPGNPAWHNKWQVSPPVGKSINWKKDAWKYCQSLSWQQCTFRHWIFKVSGNGAKLHQHPAYLSLLLRELTSLFMASAVSVTSSSSRCSFLRAALARCASSSDSSSWRLSCFKRTFTLSACRPTAVVRSQPYSFRPNARQLTSKPLLCSMYLRQY